MNELGLVALGALGATLAALLWLTVSTRRALEAMRVRDAGASGTVEALQRQVEAVRGEARADQDAVRREVGGLGARVSSELGEVRSEVARSLQEGMRLIQSAQVAMGERLDRTTRVVGEVQGSLGRLGEATQRVVDIGRDLQGLELVLRSPKLRGGLGETMLEQVLADLLPSEHYTLQHAFRGGEKADAAVLLGGRLVAIDAKFPMESFRRLVAEPDEERRRGLRRAFARDVRARVDEIADKYIRPDENTFDFALMYVPAENVYYEIIIREGGDAEESIAAHALARRVVPVSPNSLWAYLQVVVLGLRGLRIEARAREIQDDLARLLGDLGRVREHLGRLGQHLGNAHKQFLEAERDLARIEAKLDAVEQRGERGAAPGETP